MTDPRQTQKFESPLKLKPPAEPRTRGADQLVAEGELRLGPAALFEGMKLTGIDVWEQADGGLLVTLPPSLEAGEGSPDGVERLKHWIGNECSFWRKAAE